MSWDVILMNLGGLQPPKEEALRPFPMGTAEHVRASISHSMPSVDWSDPAWGILDREQWSIEFNLGPEPIIEGVMLHVRGGGDPVPEICRLCRENSWEALDCSTGEFLDLAAPARDGWEGFKRFRDRALGLDKEQKP